MTGKNIVNKSCLVSFVPQFSVSAFPLIRVVKSPLLAMGKVDTCPKRNVLYKGRLPFHKENLCLIQALSNRVPFLRLRSSADWSVSEELKGRCIVLCGGTTGSVVLSRYHVTPHW